MSTLNHDLGDLAQISNGIPKGVSTHLQMDLLTVDILVLKHTRLAASLYIADLASHTKNNFVRNDQRAVGQLLLSAEPDHLNSSVIVQETIGIVVTLFAVARPTARLLQLAHRLTILVEHKHERLAGGILHIAQIEREFISRRISGRRAAFGNIVFSAGNRLVEHIEDHRDLLVLQSLVDVLNVLGNGIVATLAHILQPDIGLSLEFLPHGQHRLMLDIRSRHVAASHRLIHLNRILRVGFGVVIIKLTDIALVKHAANQLAGGIHSFLSKRALDQRGNLVIAIMAGLANLAHPFINNLTDFLLVIRQGVSVNNITRPLGQHAGLYHLFSNFHLSSLLQNKKAGFNPLSCCFFCFSAAYSLCGDALHMIHLHTEGVRILTHAFPISSASVCLFELVPLHLQRILRRNNSVHLRSGIVFAHTGGNLVKHLSHGNVVIVDLAGRNHGVDAVIAFVLISNKSAALQRSSTLDRGSSRFLGNTLVMVYDQITKHRYFPPFVLSIDKFLPHGTSNIPVAFQGATWLVRYGRNLFLSFILVLPGNHPVGCRRFHFQSLELTDQLADFSILRKFLLGKATAFLSPVTQRGNLPRFFFGFLALLFGLPFFFILRQRTHVLFKTFNLLVPLAEHIVEISRRSHQLNLGLADNRNIAFLNSVLHFHKIQIALFALLVFDPRNVISRKQECDPRIFHTVFRQSLVKRPA
nr:MAG TPA: hypothetical protein [Caudoviricetes sp.]